MTTKRVLVTYDGLEEYKESLKEAAPDATFHFASSEEEALHLINSADVFCGRPTEELLAEAENLQWVQVTSAGVNQLPLKTMQNRNIILTNVRGMHAEPIADHVMSLILAWSRDLPRRIDLQRKHKWEREGNIEELAGEVLGIIGVGGIGKAVAKRAKAFDMYVIGTRRSAKPLNAVDEMYHPEGLTEVLEQSRYLAVCCPLTRETEGLLGLDEFRCMPSDAFIVNIARGAIIEEEQLIYSLREGVLGGAGLDVFESEPLPEDSPLWGMENVIVTPHIAGRQKDYVGKVARRFAENLRRWYKNVPLKWKVNYELGY